MNKKTLVVAIIALILVLGGFVMTKSKKVTNISNNSNNNVFTSVKDALTKKMTLVCEFSDDKGTFTKSYIKNGAIRVTSPESSSGSGDFILKDNKMYMWDTKTKEGFIYSVPEGDQSTQISQGDEYLNMVNTYKDSCKVDSVMDSYFEVPTDVNFQDMSKILEDLQKQMPQASPIY